MKYNNLDDLMAAWINERQEYLPKGFYKDGIICKDENEWRKRDFRPLIILKDVNTDKKSSGVIDFIHCENEDIVRGYQEATWRKVAAIINGLHCIYQSKDFPPSIHQEQLKNVTKYHEVMDTAAIINIKKMGGESSCNDGILRHYAEEDCLFLQNQIQLINPTVIYCGKTFEACINGKPPVFDCNGAIKPTGQVFGENNKQRCHEVLLNDRCIPVIDGFHPSAWRNIDKLYNNSCKAYKAFLDSKK